MGRYDLLGWQIGLAFLELWSGAMNTQIEWSTTSVVEWSWWSGVGEVEWLFWEWSAPKQANL